MTSQHLPSFSDVTMATPENRETQCQEEVHDLSVSKVFPYSEQADGDRSHDHDRSHDADRSHDSGIDSPHSSILEAEKSMAAGSSDEIEEDEIDIVDVE